MDPEVFNERRESLQEVLWKQAQPVGILRDEVNAIGEHSWNFSNLEDAFKEGGVLHEEKAFLFTCTEIQYLSLNGQSKVTFIPVFVVIVSRFPPSDKIGVRSKDSGFDDIVDMETINLGWVPFVPVVEGGGSADSQIFRLGYVQTEADIGLDPTEILQSCIPYFNNPFTTQERSVVNITYPSDAEEGGALVWEYNWELEDPETFTNELIAGDILSPYHKEAFKELVNEKVEEGRRANLEALRKRIQAQEELWHQGIHAAAFERMKFYKFYPVATPDTPDLSSVKFPYINQYFGNAHQVF